MKGSIIYSSKYGATRQYAEWLADELKQPVMQIDDMTAQNLPDSGFVLIGTPVYFGKLLVKKWLNKHARLLRDKKIFLFVVNATAPDEQLKRDRFITGSVPAEIRSRCEIFFLPGRLVHKSLSFFDRLIMKMAGAQEKDIQKRKAMTQDIDEVKKDNLRPLVIAVKNIMSPVEAVS